MFKRLALGAFAAMALVACGGMSTPANGNLRVVHASANTPNVDVYVGGTAAANKVLSNVAFSKASGYLSVPVGSNSIKVCAANSDPTVAANCPISVPSFSVSGGAFYTVLAVGVLNGTPALEPLALTDDNTAPASGKAKLRLVHAAAKVPGTNGAVDVYITAPGADINAASPTIAGFKYKDASAYQEVAAGDYQVRITLPGTKTVAIDTGKVTLAAGKIYTGIALDTAGTTFQAALLTDN